jgi:subtilisin family serine protease
MNLNQMKKEGRKMKVKIKLMLAVFIISELISGKIFLIAQETQIEAPKYPDLSKARGSSKGGEITDKLTPELRILYSQYRNSNTKGGVKSPVEIVFSDEQLQEIFGITNAKSDNPTIGVAVTVDSSNDLSLLKQAGMKIYLRQDQTVYGEASISSLAKLAGEKSVTEISATKSAKMPELPQDLASPMTTNGAQISTENSKDVKPTAAALANEFNKAGLTGKGVIIGVIDTGIDWRHSDFIKPDGTSRIIALWDFVDNSYKESGGKIGSAPPQFDKGEQLWGTVYTNAQINAALKGTGTVNSVDNFGHGTAVAGTAAGNGGKSGAKFAGVAPEADLIIVKAADCRGFASNYLYGAVWIVHMAKQLKRPVVVNQSFGEHFSTHNGNEQEEAFLNTLTGKGIPGVVFTVSAGNEGNYSFHASGVFGPRKEGQADIESRPLTVHILPKNAKTNNSSLLGVFDALDEWGTIVQPIAAAGFADKDGKPLWFYVFKSKNQLKYLLGDGLNKPDWFDDYMNKIITNSRLGAKNDILVLGLPAGSYRLWGFGATKTVVNGNFDFYAPSYNEVDFGMGTSKTGMIGSPGNAANVITVGAYNFRRDWTNRDGQQTLFNLRIGDISDYSNPGGKRRTDGVVKPDIVAPATFTISTLSQTAIPGSTSCGGKNMATDLGNRFISSDGLHIAWLGTSASAPFTAGVIALMLQKNPTLDADEVRQILIRTAKKGGPIGGVPNPVWGYGMLDPAASLKATPLKK